MTGFICISAPPGVWSPEEDKALSQLVAHYGPKRWSHIATFLAGRTGKQCRERWRNHLDPHITKEPFTHAEDAMILEYVHHLGTKWAQIALKLPGRTDNSIKNRYYSSLLKKTHERRLNRFIQQEDELIMTLVARMGTKWVEIAKQLPGRTSKSIKNRYYSALKKSQGSAPHPDWPLELQETFALQARIAQQANSAHTDSDVEDDADEEDEDEEIEENDDDDSDELLLTSSASKATPRSPFSFAPIISPQSQKLNVQSRPSEQTNQLPQLQQLRLATTILPSVASFAPFDAQTTQQSHHQQQQQQRIPSLHSLLQSVDEEMRSVQQQQQSAFHFTSTTPNSQRTSLIAISNPISALSSSSSAPSSHRYSAEVDSNSPRNNNNNNNNILLPSLRSFASPMPPPSRFFHDNPLPSISSSVISLPPSHHSQVMMQPQSQRLHSQAPPRLSTVPPMHASSNLNVVSRKRPASPDQSMFASALMGLYKMKSPTS
jgi:hypothetical protein